MTQERVPAFTVIEIVVTLILTAIVFSIGLFAYRVFHNQFQQYSGEVSKQTELFILKRALDRDIKNCERLELIDAGFNCLTDTSSTSYIIDGDLLIRGNAFAVQDSFLLQDLLVSTSFENKETLVLGEFIDRIKIEFTQGERRSVFQLEKQYDAYTLMFPKSN